MPLLPAPPPPPDTDPLVVRLHALIDVAMVLAREIDVQTETLRMRGYTTSHESSLMQVWRNDASVAYAIVETLRKAEHYLTRMRTLPREPGA